VVAQELLALGLCAIQGHGRSYLVSLKEYVANPPRLLSAIAALWTTYPIIQPLQELERRGVARYAVYAAGDTAIPVPWRRLLTGKMPAHVTVVPGTHSSNILGLGPSYEAVLGPVLAALGRAKAPSGRFRVLPPRPLRILSEILHSAA
jgi:hypothetical protein